MRISYIRILVTKAITLISNQIWLVFMLDSIFSRRSGLILLEISSPLKEPTSG